MVATTFLAGLFGEGGLVQQGLGNLWFMVAVFILVFFILMLAGFKITAENIVIFIITSRSSKITFMNPCLFENIYIIMLSWQHAMH